MGNNLIYCNNAKGWSIDIYCNTTIGRYRSIGLHNSIAFLWWSTDLYMLPQNSMLENELTLHPLSTTLVCKAHIFTVILKLTKTGQKN